MDIRVGDRVAMDGYKGDGVPRHGSVDRVRGVFVTLLRVKDGREAYRSYRVDHIDGLRRLAE